jgi:hypothetical protein
MNIARELNAVRILIARNNLRVKPLEYFDFSRGDRDRLSNLPEDQFERVLKILNNVWRSAPSSGKAYGDDRPASKLFKYYQAKWWANYYHDGSLISVSPDKDGELSKIISMTGESKRQFRKKHGLPSRDSNPNWYRKF